MLMAVRRTYMENKIIKIKVDKTNKLLLCIIGLFILFLSLIVGVVLGEIFKLSSLMNEILIEFLLVVFSFIILKSFYNVFSEQELEAVFTNEYVVLKKKNSKRTIYYNDIIEVQKIMILNRMHEEKGYYRVRVKCKGRDYVLYSTETEYDKHMDFDEVEVSEIYFELKKRGVKCC